MNSNKKLLTIITILLVLCTCISASYAFFRVASSNNNANSSVTINGVNLCMSLQLSSNNVTLSNEYAVPVSDAKALSSDVYKTEVTIQNNCGDAQSFNLLLVPNSSNTMPIKALKYALVEEGVTPTSGTLISNEYILDSTIQKQLLSIKNETLKNGFSVGSGTVNANTTKTFNLYLWIDKDEGNLGNGSTMDKVLNAYLTLGSGTTIGEIKLDLYHTIENRYNEDKTYLGLYTGEGADTYANPVYYYKGNVENNNVLFGGFCWKIVRTTETGGIKMVYNGVQKDVYESYEKINENAYNVVSNDETYPYTFDSTSKTWVSTNKTNSATGTITFTIDTAGDYHLSYVMSSEVNWDKAKFYKNGNPLGDSNGYSGTQSGAITITGLTTSDVIKVEYTKDSTGASGSDTVTFSIGKAVGDPVKSCNNTGTDSQIGTSAFNSSYNSPAYVGYMFNKDKVYTCLSKLMSSQSNIVFGNSFTYNGTYTLTGTKTVATWSSGYNTINNNHYTCMTTGTTCSSIYYVYYTDSAWAYYITLTNGKTVNDALNEMLYADDVNKDDSTIKAYIDSWYENNLANYEDNLEKNIVFCSDRSIYSLNGWNPNGGSTTNNYGLRFTNPSTSNTSLVCANETDRFSVSNSKAQLKHPIGLLSEPELELAGYRDSHYFNNGQNVWLVSPQSFDSDRAYVGAVNPGGWLTDYVSHTSGVRPSVSIQPGTEYTSGDGSFTNPFVIAD